MPRGRIKKGQPTGKYLKDDHTIHCLNIYYTIRSGHENKTIDDIKLSIRDNIVSELWNSNLIQKVIPVMCKRTGISKSTKIHEDVLQESFLQLSRYNIDDMFLAYCHDPTRIIGLATTITQRTGFGKLDDHISPNQSVAKQILFASSLNQQWDKSYGESGDYLFNNKIDLSYTPPFLDDEIKVWDIIKSELDEEDKEFLDFLIKNIFNKKVIKYGYHHRRTYLSLNEFKIKYRMMEFRIREIIKNKGIKL